MEHTAHYALEWLGSDNFMPHGHCYLWTPELLWTYVISESVIVMSYFSIPFALMYFISKRRDLQFNWIFKLFSLFIFACGITHLLGIWTIRYPDYWLDALVMAVTADDIRGRSGVALAPDAARVETAQHAAAGRSG